MNPWLSFILSLSGGGGPVGGVWLRVVLGSMKYKASFTILSCPQHALAPKAEASSLNNFIWRYFEGQGESFK